MRSKVGLIAYADRFAGFDPQDHTQVNPRLGSWADIAALSADCQVMADVIVNHVSSSCANDMDLLARTGVAVTSTVTTTHLRRSMPAWPGRWCRPRVGSSASATRTRRSRET